MPDDLPGTAEDSIVFTREDCWIVIKRSWKRPGDGDIRMNVDAGWDGSHVEWGKSFYSAKEGWQTASSGADFGNAFVPKMTNCVNHCAALCRLTANFWPVKSNG